MYELWRSFSNDLFALFEILSDHQRSDFRCLPPGNVLKSCMHAFCILLISLNTSDSLLDSCHCRRRLPSRHDRAGARLVTCGQTELRGRLSHCHGQLFLRTSFSSWSTIELTPNNRCQPMRLTQGLGLPETLQSRISSSTVVFGGWMSGMFNSNGTRKLIRQDCNSSFTM